MLRYDDRNESYTSFILENEDKVIKWLRPAKEQFNIYWSNGSKRYEPDFIVETEDILPDKFYDVLAVLQINDNPTWCKVEVRYNLTRQDFVTPLETNGDISSR